MSQLYGVTVQAPAKLNLSLDVVGLLPGGYHSLDMIMQAVTLYERVELHRSAQLTLTLPGSTVSAGADNTALKAARAFFDYTGLEGGADILVYKSVPVRAGMAGGSADAAAVLVGLNTLYDAKLSFSELCALGAGIGADVPFALMGGTCRVQGVGDLIRALPPCPDCWFTLSFSELCALGAGIGADVPFALMGGTCRVQGVGDLIRALPPCPDCWFTVVMPGYGVSTPEAFAAYDRIGASHRPDCAAQETAVRAGSLEALCAAAGNALEGSLEALCAAAGNALEECSGAPDNEAIKALLRQQGAQAALMTGSGAAVFGVFTQEQAARAAAAAASGAPDNEAIKALLRQQGAQAALMTGSGAAVFGVFTQEQAARAAAAAARTRWPQAYVYTGAGRTGSRSSGPHPLAAGLCGPAGPGRRPGLQLGITPIE